MTPCFSDEDVEQAVQFCKEQFALSERNDKGVALREILEQLEQQLGYPPPELQNYTTELPTGFEQVWAHFLHLHTTRNVGMSLCPITYLEIEAYSRLTNNFLEAEEIAVIKRLDSACLEEINRQSTVKQKRSESKSAKSG